MLPRHHRLTRPSEISAVVSRGRKKANGLVVVYVRRASAGGKDAVARATVIAGKNVGGAPARNRIKRRMRHILLGLIREGTLRSTYECVVRALPGSSAASSLDLRRAIQTAVTDAAADVTARPVTQLTDEARPHA